MKTFEEFFEEKCHCRIGVSISGERYEDSLAKLMNCCAAYMDYITSQPIVSKLEEIRCGLIDIESSIEKTNEKPHSQETCQDDCTQCNIVRCDFRRAANPGVSA